MTKKSGESLFKGNRDKAGERKVATMKRAEHFEAQVPRSRMWAAGSGLQSLSGTAKEVVQQKSDFGI